MPAHKKYLYTIIEHTGKILAEKVSRTEAQKVSGFSNISGVIYNRSNKCNPNTPHRLYIALYDLEGNLVYMPKILPWPGTRAIKKPPSENIPMIRERRDCIHHDGCECQALKETYCKLEEKPCRFYKPRGEVQQHEQE